MLIAIVLAIGVVMVGAATCDIKLATAIDKHSAEIRDLESSVFGS